jgi:hypothetical protein
MLTDSTRSFPPPRLADLSSTSAGNFVSLAKELKHTVTLVLGAGVSSSAGVPFWGTLLERMCAAFFEHWTFDDQMKDFSPQRPPSKMTIAFTDHDTYSLQARELGKKLASSDLLLAAQQIKNCIRDQDWCYLLRKVLYGPIGNAPRSSSLIDSLGRLCACDTRTVRDVISYNYDDLLTHVLLANGTKHHHLHEGKNNGARKELSLPIYFVHGFLPIKGGDSSRIVLAETDYHQEAASPFAWGNQVQLQHFAQSTCIFIGNSMTDPNARRLLRLARTTSDSPHFCFLPQSNNEKNKPFEVLFDHDLRKLGVLPIRFPKKDAGDPYGRLPELIELLTLAAANVNAIWE